LIILDAVLLLRATGFLVAVNSVTYLDQLYRCGQLPMKSLPGVPELSL